MAKKPKKELTEKEKEARKIPVVGEIPENLIETRAMQPPSVLQRWRDRREIRRKGQ